MQKSSNKMSRQASHPSHRIARSAGVLAMATGVSRILGFIRDIFLARFFGTTIQSQAFVVAFRLPNLLRDLVAEGAVTSAFVPTLSWYMAKGEKEEFWKLSQALLARLLVVLVSIGLLGYFAAPLIVRLIAPGFISQPEKFSLTVRLTRILFPFITLVGLWAYCMGLLNALRHFAIPALGPAILNLSMIAACIWFVPHTSPGIIAVAVGVMVGGVVQLLMQLPIIMKLGFKWRWRWNHPGSAELLRLLIPRTLGSAVYQLSVFIDTALASLGWIVGEGAVSALYFANRLVQLPLALFGTASAQASLPSLAEQAAHNNWEGFRSTLLSVLRMVGFVALPSAVGLAVLAFPIVGGLFERGLFDHRSTIMTSQALICYSFGLLAYAFSKVITGAFYALKDTWTPVKLAMEAFAANVLLSVILMWPLKLNGLAIAAAITNTINAYRLLRGLERRMDAPLIKPLIEPLLRMGYASAFMGIGCWLFWNLGNLALHPLLGLLAVIAGGIALYGISCKLLHVHEFSTVAKWLKRLPLLGFSAGE